MFRSWPSALSFTLETWLTLDSRAGAVYGPACKTGPAQGRREVRLPPGPSEHSGDGSHGPAPQRPQPEAASPPSAEHSRWLMTDGSLVSPSPKSVFSELGVKPALALVLNKQHQEGQGEGGPAPMARARPSEGLSLFMEILTEA